MPVDRGIGRGVAHFWGQNLNTNLKDLVELSEGYKNQRNLTILEKLWSFVLAPLSMVLVKFLLLWRKPGMSNTAR